MENVIPERKQLYNIQKKKKKRKVSIFTTKNQLSRKKHNNAGKERQTLLKTYGKTAKWQKYYYLINNDFKCKQKKILHTNSNHKRKGMTMQISDKVNFKSEVYKTIRS